MKKERLFLKSTSWFLFIIIVIYSIVILMSIQYGTPNQQHPFPYHMDEWHQFHAVGTTFKYGTPNIAGSANGTILHFVLSGLYIAPFSVLDYIHLTKLSIEDGFMRERIFLLLRLNTILWGIGAMIIFWHICEYMKLPKKLLLVLFTFNPIWISLSGYFKYDIALLFWIMLSFLCLLRYVQFPSARRFIIASIVIGLTFSVKVSTVPMIMLLIICYTLYGLKGKQNLTYFIIGLFVLVSTILLFGMPDTLFGKGNIIDYVYTNVIVGPRDMANFVLNEHPLVYLFGPHYLVLFGTSLYSLAIISLVFLVFSFFTLGYTKIVNQYRYGVVSFITFCLFIGSIMPLQLWGGGNRSLVLLPFIVIFIGYFYNYIEKKINKNLLIFIIVCCITVQFIETYNIWRVKTLSSIPEDASVWIEKNIPAGKVIGLENIPIYQGIADIAQKEFYYKQYGIKRNTFYQYQVISAKSKQLPEYIMVSNADEETNIYKSSPKIDLLARLKKDGYTQIVFFNAYEKYLLRYIQPKEYFLSWLIPQSSLSLYRR